MGLREDPKPFEVKYQVGDTGVTRGGYPYTVITVPATLSKVITAELVARVDDIPRSGNPDLKESQIMGYTKEGRLNLTLPVRTAIMKLRGLKPNDLDLTPPDTSTSSLWETSGDIARGALLRIAGGKTT